MPVEVDVRWDPDAVLAMSEGIACLAMRPHFDDKDRRAVALVFNNRMSGDMSPPNDEALHMHALYDHGLSGILWVGEVTKSKRIRATAPMVARAPTRHFIVPLKDRTVEVLADALTVARLDGPPSEAALAAIRSAN